MSERKVANRQTHLDFRLGTLLKSRTLHLDGHGLTISGRLTRNDLDALVRELVEAIDAPPSDHEVLMAAAHLCPHSPRDIDSNYPTEWPRGVCRCGIRWDIPDPGYPYRPFGWVASGADRRAEVAAMLAEPASASPAAPETEGGQPG